VLQVAEFIAAVQIIVSAGRLCAVFFGSALNALEETGAKKTKPTLSRGSVRRLPRGVVFLLEVAYWMAPRDVAHAQAATGSIDAGSLDAALPPK